MEYQKIAKLLVTTFDKIPTFITKKWVEVHDQSGSADDRCKSNKQIRFKTSMLRSDLYDFSDAYIVVKGGITFTKTNRREFIDTRTRFLAFKNNAPFTNCLSKINNILIDNVEDLDIVMPMYNLLKYGKNYRKTTESLWNYYRDGPNNPPLHDDDPFNINYNADPITNSEYFKYKSSITGETSNANQDNSETPRKKIQRLKKILKLLFH